MSEKKTIIGKVVEAILSVFKENWQAFIAKLWPKIPGQMQGEILAIIGIVNTVKTFADMTLWDAIVAATEGKGDDKLLSWVRTALHNITKEYNIASKPVAEMKRGDWQTLAAELNVASTGVSYGQASISNESGYWNS